MKLKELKKGDIFNIENTSSYPKLKLDKGYVDIRDDIVNVSSNCDDREVFMMDLDDLQDLFKEPQDVLADEMEGLLVKFNN